MEKERGIIITNKDYVKSTKRIVNKRFKVIKIELSDYKTICICDNKTNKIICHMNTLDCDFNELLKQAKTMTSALNV